MSKEPLIPVSMTKKKLRPDAPFGSRVGKIGLVLGNIAKVKKMKTLAVKNITTKKSMTEVSVDD